MEKRVGLAILSMLLAVGCNNLSQEQKPGSGESPAKTEAPEAPGVAPAPDRLITESSAGSVKLGMTVAQVREALPGMVLARTTDGEGMALIEVKDGADVVMILYAGEEDAESPIAEQAKVEHISVHDKRYATAEGVHPQMLLSAVEEKYGKLTRIFRSEIESREYGDFPKLPEGFSLQVGTPELGEAGVYPEGKSETTEYVPEAVILNISIS